MLGASQVQMLLRRRRRHLGVTTNVSLLVRVRPAKLADGSNHQHVPPSLIGKACFTKAAPQLTMISLGACITSSTQRKEAMVNGAIVYMHVMATRRRWAIASGCLLIPASRNSITKARIMLGALLWITTLRGAQTHIHTTNRGVIANTNVRIHPLRTQRRCEN